MTREQFEGCLLGLALGDALGAPYEGGPVERFVWWLIGKTRQGKMRWTDDTQMSIDVAESLLAKATVDPEDLATRFAASYRWSRGYGPGAARLLKRIAKGVPWKTANRSVYRDGSFGNGGAMRAPIIGLVYARRFDELVLAAQLSASITHSHPLGIEGAVLIACATTYALQRLKPLQILKQTLDHCSLEPFTSRLAIAANWVESKADPSAKTVARNLGNGVAASHSCVTALYLALRFMDRPFYQLQDFARRCRGDVDTIGAMAGAIWGAGNGSGELPAESLAKLEQREQLVALASSLHAKAI